MAKLSWDEEEELVSKSRSPVTKLLSLELILHFLHRAVPYIGGLIYTRSKWGCVDLYDEETGGAVSVACFGNC